MSPAPNPSTALARVLADELARGGVRHAVLAPGSRSTALALALDGRDDLRLHVEVDERSAAFLALGIARVSGQPAAVVSTSGTAAANLHPAVLEADAARVPLLVLTADRPGELRDTGANQTVDQIKLYGGAVRWFCALGPAESRSGAVAYWRSTVDHALAAATGVAGPAGPAGPVHVNVALREPSVPLRDDGRTRAPTGFEHPLDGRGSDRPWTAVTATRRQPTSDQVLSLARRIGRTDEGLLLVGDTEADPGPVLSLAAASGWPVIAEPLSGARRGPQVIPTAHHLVANETFAAAHRPELVLRIGRAVLSREIAAWLDATVPQVLLDPDGAWLDPSRTVSEILVADVGATCRALEDRLAASKSSQWLAEWRRADRAAREAIDGILDATAEPTEPRTARDVAAAVPDGGVLVVGSSMPVRDLDRFMRPRAGLRVIGNRGASGIDGFVSTALGAALAGDQPTVALTGDLSLLHDANGFLLTADGPPPECTFVVVDNDGGGIFHFLPQADQPGFERLFATPHGRDLSRLAELHELGHRRVDEAEQLPGVVTDSLGQSGSWLVEVDTDREANAELHGRIQEAVDAALA